MSIAALLALLTTFLHSTAGLSVAALVGSWVAGKGITMLLNAEPLQHLLGLALQTAKVPGVALGRWLKAGPLHLVFGPVVCLLIFVGFWFFTFMDSLLSASDPDTVQLADGLEAVLGKVGSTDRKLYIQAKGMTAPQVEAVSKMAAAVAAQPVELTEGQKATLLAAQAVGDSLQAARLAAGG